MTIIDYYYNNGSAGSFESAIFNGWMVAGHDNRRRLENAFPDMFPVARMYGVHDFRGFASYEQFEKAVLPYIVKMNQWGKMVEAVRMPWAEFKNRDHTPTIYPTMRMPFEVHERAFGSFISPSDNKEVECLCFGDYYRGDNILWYVTEEKLEEIKD